MVGSGSESELMLILKAKNLASREVDKLHGSLGRVGTSLKSAGGKLADFGKTAALVGGGAILALGAALFGAGKAAAAEQKGILKMNAALKANDKSFKGNTDAIEATIAKREELAFSDDDLRDSLTLLVTKTKDSSRAIALQTTAMDLARLKGISLTDASAMLTKGLDGNSKILKQLGIDLPATATQQQRLTAIQAAAAGQAEAYGKSEAGAQEAFGIALGDVVEDIGGLVLPILTDFFTMLRKDVLPAVKSIIGSVAAWISQNQPLITQIRDVLTKVISAVATAIGTVVTWIANLAAAITSNKTAMDILKNVAGLIGDAFTIVWQVVSKSIDFLGRLAAWITSNKTIMGALKLAFQAIGSAIGIIVDGLQWIINNAAKALNALGDLREKNRGHDPVGDFLFPPGHASGGWVGLNGPELSWVGERGPEYIVPNHQLGSVGGTPVEIPIIIDGREISRLIDKRLYLARAASGGSTKPR